MGTAHKIYSKVLRLSKRFGWDTSYYDYNNSFRDVPWVNAVGNIIAENFMRENMLFYRVQNRRQKEMILKNLHTQKNDMQRHRKFHYVPNLTDYPLITASDPFYDVINPPDKKNEDRIPSLSYFNYVSMINYIIFGQTFYKKQIVGNDLEGLELIPSYGMQTERDQKTNRVKAWYRNVGDGTVKYPVNDKLIHPMVYNPYDQDVGLSFVTVAGLSIEQWINMAIYNTKFFGGSFIPKFVLKSDRNITEKAKKGMIDSLMSLFSGRGFAILDHSVDIKRLFEGKDIDFQVGMNKVREEMLSSGRVPPAIAGIFEYSNYANSDAQRLFAKENMLAPKMIYFRDIWQTQILDKHFPDIVIDFDWSSFWSTDEHKDMQTQKIKAETAAIWWKMGIDYFNVGLEMAEPKEEEGAEQFDDDDIDIDLEEEKIYVSKHIDKVHVKISSRELYRLNDKYTKNVLNKNVKKTKKNIELLLDNIAEDIIEKYKDNVAKIDYEQYYTTWLNDFIQMDVKEMLYKFIVNSQDELRQLKKTFNYDIYTKQESNIQKLIDKIPEELLVAAGGLLSVIYEKTQRIITRVIENVKGLVSKTSIQGMPVEQFEKLLLGEMDTIKTMKSEITARAIVGMASNSGRFISFNYYGVIRCAWASSEDEVVRDDHVAEHGNVIKLGERFPITNCRFPLDPTADLKQIMNCRCWLVAVEINIRGNIRFL